MHPTPSFFRESFSESMLLFNAIAIKNSYAIPLPFEGRWSAEKRALVVTKSAFRTLHRGIYG
jgi:hypothetical protein